MKEYVTQIHNIPFLVIVCRKSPDFSALSLAFSHFLASEKNKTEKQWKQNEQQFWHSSTNRQIFQKFLCGMEPTCISRLVSKSSGISTIMDVVAMANAMAPP